MYRSFQVMICAIIFFAVSAYAAERAAVGIPEPQRLSAEGKSELLGIVSSGRLKTLQEPQFADYKAEIGEFYGSGGYALAWVRGSRPTAKARAVIRILQAADNKGLLAQDYDSPFWTARLAKLERPARRASEHDLLRFDIALTICAMRYILDLHLGRINPKLFYCGFDAEPDIRGPSDYLRKRVVFLDVMMDPSAPDYNVTVKVNLDFQSAPTVQQEYKLTFDGTTAYTDGEAITLQGNLVNRHRCVIQGNPKDCQLIFTENTTEAYLNPDPLVVHKPAKVFGFRIDARAKGIR